MKKISLVLLSLFFALVLFDLCLGLFGYQKRPHSWIFANEEFYQDSNYRNFFTVDRNEIFSPRPNTSIIPDYWETDQFGFRLNPDRRPLDHSINLPTILVLGDSQAYGHGVNHRENWVYRLEKNLNENKSPENQVVIHNAAVPATGTDQQFIRYQNLVKKFKPTTVIWMVSQNDMVDSNLSCLYKKTNSGVYLKLPAALNVAYLNGWSMKLLPKWFIGTNLGNLLTTFTFGQYDLFTWGCSQDAPDEIIVESYFPKLEFIIKEAKKIAEDQHFKLILLLAPPQVYFDRTYGNDSYEITFFQKFITAFNKSNVNYVNLPQEMAERWDPALGSYRSGLIDRDEYLDRQHLKLNYGIYIDESVEGTPYGGWHLNSFGNYLVADILTQYLEN